MEVTGYLYTPTSKDGISQSIIEDQENSIRRQIDKIFPPKTNGKIEIEEKNEGYIHGLLILDTLYSGNTIKEITRTILRLRLIFPHVNLIIKGDVRTKQYLEIKLGDKLSERGENASGELGLKYFQDAYFPLQGKRNEISRNKLQAIIDALGVNTIEGLIHGFLDLKEFQKVLELPNIGSYFIWCNFLPNLVDFCYKSNLRVRGWKRKIENEVKIKPKEPGYQKYIDTISKREQLEDAVSY